MAKRRKKKDVPIAERNQITLSKVMSDAELMDLEPDEIKEPESDYSGLKVICPGCGLRQFETTSRYNPKKHAHPGMLRQVEPYESWGWDGAPPDPTAGYGCLECGECGSVLAPAGFLTVTVEEA